MILLFFLHQFFKENKTTIAFAKILESTKTASSKKSINVYNSISALMT